MFGFGKGKIGISISKYNFSPGDTIEGAISLNVKKPTKAKAVTIRLVGQQKTTRTTNMPNTTNNFGAMQQQMRTAYIYDFKQPLDGEKDYNGDYNYNFQIKIPQNILGGMNSMLDSVAKSLQAFSRQYSQVKWYLIASLDIPWGVDISKKLQVNIA